MIKQVVFVLRLLLLLLLRIWRPRRLPVTLGAGTGLDWGASSGAVYAGQWVCTGCIRKM
jgi:hypothetical protein